MKLIETKYEPPQKLEKREKISQEIDDEDEIIEDSFEDRLFESIAGFKEKHTEDLYEEDLDGLLNIHLNSDYEEIELGRREDGRPFYASLEQLMNHMRFLAPSRKGKSTSFIGLAQEISRRGFGFFIADSSDQGDTVKKLLGFCQRENKKYLYIDLNETNNPVINPFEIDQYKSVVYLKDAFQVLFGVKDSATTANISKYLPAILHVLMNARLSLTEAKYFTSKIYKAQQEYILGKSRCNELNSHYRLLIEEARFLPRVYERFISTTSRLEPLNHPAIEALFGEKSSANLKELIENNYIILLNTAVDGLDDLQKRFVTTVIINMILYHHTSGKHYWLFIDEAQDYATGKVGEMLDKKAKSGLHVGLLNHHDDQFEDQKLKTSVKVNIPIKFEFPKKQEAWVTLNEMEPIYLRMPEIYTEYGTIKGSPYNRKREHILEKIRARMYDIESNIGEDITPAKPRTTSHRKTDQPDPSEPREKREQGKRGEAKREPGQKLWEDL